MKTLCLLVIRIINVVKNVVFFPYHSVVKVVVCIPSHITDCPVRRECSAAILLFYFRAAADFQRLSLSAHSALSGRKTELYWYYLEYNRAVNYYRAYRTSRGAVRYVVFSD